MKKSTWLTTGLVLALAGTMMVAGPVWAQGPGGGPQGQGNQWGQGGGMGPGAGAANCPNYPRYQNCPVNRGDNTQAPRGRRGMRGGGRNNQATTQTTPPAVTQ